MASAVDKQPASARLAAVAAAGCLPTATNRSQNSYTTSGDTTSLAGVLVETQAATETQCDDALSDDLASECEFETISASGTNDGYFEAWRPTGSGDESNFTSITVALEDVGDLVNCSGNLATSC